MKAVKKIFNPNTIVGVAMISIVAGIAYSVVKPFIKGAIPQSFSKFL